MTFRSFVRSFCRNFCFGKQDTRIRFAMMPPCYVTIQLSTQIGDATSVEWTAATLAKLTTVFREEGREAFLSPDEEHRTIDALSRISHDCTAPGGCHRRSS